MSPAPSDPVVYPAKFPQPSTIEALHTYRSQALRTGAYNHALSIDTVNKVSDHIGYYPELQAATLRALAADPDPDLLAAMANAVLEQIRTPGESPSEADRIVSINAVTEALKAAAKHVTPPEEAPF